MPAASCVRFHEDLHVLDPAGYTIVFDQITRVLQIFAQIKKGFLILLGCNSKGIVPLELAYIVRVPGSHTLAVQAFDTPIEIDNDGIFEVRS